jgi:hypothetical protein
MGDKKPDLVSIQQIVDFGSLETLNLTGMIKILQKGGKTNYGF